MFRYDAETGKLYWKSAPNGHRQVVGKECGGIRRWKNGAIYRVVKLNAKYRYAHRVCFLLHYGYMPEMVDHIDGNGINNKAENIRAATSSANQKNLKKPKNNTSGFIGVSWVKSLKKWHAYGSIDGKRINIGWFDDISKAVSARKEFDREHGYSELHGRAS